MFEVDVFVQGCVARDCVFVTDGALALLWGGCGLISLPW